MLFIIIPHTFSLQKKDYIYNNKFLPHNQPFYVRFLTYFFFFFFPTPLSSFLHYEQYYWKFFHPFHIIYYFYSSFSPTFIFFRISFLYFCDYFNVLICIFLSAFIFCYAIYHFQKHKNYIIFLPIFSFINKITFTFFFCFFFIFSYIYWIYLQNWFPFVQITLSFSAFSFFFLLMHVSPILFRLKTGN